jgi:protocatechuate 3,4-dioxygenase alpha subunit
MLMNLDDKLLQTPSQTVGPYFAYGLVAEQYNYGHTQICRADLIINESIKGERITITGQVLDGNGDAIPDAMVEIWQADADGKYDVDKKLFQGFGRVGTGSDTASFNFHTIKPGSEDDNAPHINVIIFMRGLLVHVYTRIYFSDEVTANANDAVLSSVNESRRHTLIAKRKQIDTAIEYHFDIYMQGENETVFFDL